MVAPLAVTGGARNAHTRRAAASSVAPVATATSAPCVLASLGVDAPVIHRDHEESH
jgi:hypothetical protein